MNLQYFSIKMMEGIVATSYSTGDKFYIDLRKLLPLARFLPQPKYGLFASLWQKINLYKYHTISFHIDVLYMEMNKGEAAPNYFCSSLFEVDGDQGQGQIEANQQRQEEEEDQ